MFFVVVAVVGEKFLNALKRLATKKREVTILVFKARSRFLKQTKSKESVSIFRVIICNTIFRFHFAHEKI